LIFAAETSSAFEGGAPEFSNSFVAGFYGLKN